MKTISVSNKINSGLDDNYTLFENGEVLHSYDKHIYPGGFNLEERLSAKELSEEVKNRLLDSASESNKELARKILGL